MCPGLCKPAQRLLIYGSRGWGFEFLPGVHLPGVHLLAGVLGLPCAVRVTRPLYGPPAIARRARPVSPAELPAPAGQRRVGAVPVAPPGAAPTVGGWIVYARSTTI